jgi:hypothetical protein
MGMTTSQQTETGYYEGGSAISFFSGAAVASIPAIPAASKPPVPYILKIVVTGAVATGSVVVAGTQAGAAKSETITISGAGTYYSNEYHDANTVPTITTTGLHDEDAPPTLTITPVDPVYRQAIAGSTEFSLDWIDETVKIRDSSGDTTRFDHWFITDTAFAVGDKIRYNGVTYTVEKVKAVKLMNRTTDHYQVYV